ncbi:toxin-activating lysine-acyltransferase [Orbaceae bacterium ac157xtp]
MEKEIYVVAPSITNQKCNQTECFGSAIWLWIHSQNHRETPLYALPKILLPAISRNQFILIYENRKPIFFMSWANMNEISEKKYISKEFTKIKDEDWNSGERTWIIDWIAPFGHTKAVAKYLKQQLLSNFICRSLYHKNEESDCKICFFKGKNISDEQATQWLKAHPLAK